MKILIKKPKLVVKTMRFLTFNKYVMLRVVFVVIFLLFVWQLLKSIPLENDTIITRESTDNSTTPTLVTVYYEALCPDSRSFVLQQLVPTYAKASRLMVLDFVPYGKAETKYINGRYQFECQHGYLECVANKIHACGVKMIKSQKIQLQYVACMIANNAEPYGAGSECAQQLGIDFRVIKNCAESLDGSIYLRDFGIRTHALVPQVQFIPTIIFNNSSEISYLPKILKNLFGSLCKLYEPPPVECENI